MKRNVRGEALAGSLRSGRLWHGMQSEKPGVMRRGSRAGRRLLTGTMNGLMGFLFLCAAARATASPGGLFLYAEGGVVRGMPASGSPAVSPSNMSTKGGSQFSLGGLLHLFPGRHASLLLGGGFVQEQVQMGSASGLALAREGLGPEPSVQSGYVELATGAFFAPLSFLELQALVSFQQEVRRHLMVSRRSPAKESSLNMSAAGETANLRDASARRSTEIEAGFLDPDGRESRWLGTFRVLVPVFGLRLGAFARTSLSDSSSLHHVGLSVTSVGATVGLSI